jgi:hypothetical protein
MQVREVAGVDNTMIPSIATFVMLPWAAEKGMRRLSTGHAPVDLTILGPYELADQTRHC